MLPNDIHHVFHIVDKDGEKKYFPAGRFLVHDGSVHHLEDYHGHLARHIPTGLIDDYTMAKLGQQHDEMTQTSHTALRGGYHHHLIPMAKLDPLPAARPVPTTQQMQDHVEVKPPSVWHYTRAGHDKPHLLEAKEGKFLLDGNPLEHHEVATILDNVRTKAGKIRYVHGVSNKRNQQLVAKAEKLFIGLRKNEETEKHFQILKDMGVPDETIDHMRQRIYGDQMVPGMGNKFAYESFKEKQRPGVYVSMDGNDFKAINDMHGHEAGDAAIKAFGSAARSAMDETVGSHQSKLFRNPDMENLYRNGGDEFIAHVPTHEHAAQFARALRSKLEQIPAINGTHKLSMSFGFGTDPHSADNALYKAKEQKYSAPGIPGQRNRPRKPGMEIGNVPSLAHSNVPGFEGAVPLHHEQLAATPPEVDVRPPTEAHTSPATTSVPTPPAAPGVRAGT